MLYVLVIVFGLVIGSFLNVCIYRIPKNESVVAPASHCTNCNNELKVIDLIPVFSYIFLRGKCRYCGIKVSFRYALVEILTALVFASIFYKYQNNLFEFILYSYFMAVLIAVFFIDFDVQIIPYRLVISGLVGGLIMFVYNFYYQVDVYIDRNWWNPLLGILAGSGILFLIAIIGTLIYKTDDAMGMGDVNIFAPIGLFLGWRLTLLALFLAVFIAAIFSIIFLITKIKGRKDGIPFGPYIVASTYIMFLFGNSILKLYLSFY